MKKISLVFLLVVVLLMGMSSIAGAENLAVTLTNQLKEDLGVEDVDKETFWLELNPEVIFDEEKLQRTVTIDGEEQEDVLVIVYTGGNYKLSSYADEIKRFGYDFLPDAKNFKEYAYKRITKNYAQTLGQDYGHYEIVSINGVPWQKTKYADDILKTVEEYKDTDNSLLEDNPKIMETLKDPRYNGFAYAKYYQNMSDKDILKEAERLGNKTVKNTPNNTETPIEEENNSNNSENESITIQNGAILQVGSNQVILYENGLQDIMSMLTTPEVVNGHTMIPLVVYSNLGYNLTYNGKTETVTVKGTDNSLILKIGSKKAEVNGEEIEMSIAPYVKNGRTLIPLRFVGEQLGYKVEWIGSEKKIVIGE